MHIEVEKLSNAFCKYHVRNAPFYGIFHEFSEPDSGDAHDHPFAMRITIVKGRYIERRWDLRTGKFIDIERKLGDSFRVEASTIHKIIELPEGETWTFMQPELHERNWGFYRFEGGKAYHRFNDEKEFKEIPELVKNWQDVY